MIEGGVLVLRIKPLRLILLAMGSGMLGLVFAASLIWPSEEIGPAMGWAGAVASLLASAIFLVQTRGTVRLDSEGLQIRRAFRTRAVSWNQIAYFRVVRVRFNTFVDIVKPKGWPTNGYLLPYYGLKAEAMADLLNDWLEAHSPDPCS